MDKMKSKDVYDAVYDVVIVGGGIAAQTAAAAVAARESSRRVLLLSEEDRLPYRRTKISKRLASGFQIDELVLQTPDWYGRHQVGVRVNSRAAAIDPQNSTLILQDGSGLHWKRLILAPGAAPVLPSLPGLREGIEQGRVFCLRTAREAERLRDAAAGGKSALVVGAGVLGIEVAEQLQKLGLRVALLEKLNRVMPADIDETASIMLEELLRSRGIELRLNSRVWRLRVDRPQTVTAELEEGELEGEIVVFCLGALPRTELAVKAGLLVQQGICVDSRLHTSHPGIYAAGDAAQHADGRVTHLWHAAEHQGEIAGANACGHELPYRNVPFRLKMEVLDHYFFSMSWSWNGQSGESAVQQRRNGSIYQSFTFVEGRLSGVVMIGDKPRAELYKQAVLDRYTRHRVDRELGL